LAATDEEKLGMILRNHLTQQRRGKERSSCPDEESLASYIGGNFTREVKERLEKHLSDCSFCQDELVAAHKAMEETEAETVPRRLIEKAMALVQPSKGGEEFFDLAVRLVSDFVELVSTTGQQVETLGAMPVTRATEKSSEASIIKIQKTIGKYKVTVEVEHADTGLCEVVVGIEEEGGQPAEGLRVGLISGSREQASYLIQKGVAVFDKISRGQYNLPVSESGTPLGVIRLSID